MKKTLIKTSIAGDATWLRGDVSGLTGDVSGLTGNVTGLTGDVDACELTDEDRARGVNIQDLIAPSCPVHTA